MKPFILASGAALALTTAGCGTHDRPATARLDCPANQGDLTRVNVARDGKVCTYRGADGSDISLRLMPVSRDVQSTLAAVEEELRNTPAPNPVPAAQSAAPAELPNSKTASDQARTIAEAEADAAAAMPDEKTTRHVVSVDEDGQTARVELPGLRIAAQGEKADVQVGRIHVNADDGGAVIRSSKDVRLKGEALSRTKRGVRAFLILAGPEYAGDRGYLGYMAGGPKTGPITVAVVRGGGNGGHHDHDIHNDIRRLVRLNSGT